MILRTDEEIQEVIDRVMKVGGSSSRYEGMTY